MTDLTLTDHERRAAEAGTLRYVVRPMEKQSWLAVVQDVFEPSFFHCDLDQTGATFETIDAPHAPGDTLPTEPPLEVVGVDVMRLDATDPMHPWLDPFWQKRDRQRWNDLYGHRPDWRYEANPWCWVYEVTNEI